MVCNYVQCFNPQKIPIDLNWQVTYIQFFFTGPPALTVNITKNTESSSIVVQWDEVDNSFPITYVVTWTSERDLNDAQSIGVVELSSWTITGLALDTVYTITVTATNICGHGPEYRTSVSLTTDSISTTSSSAVTVSITTTTIMSTPSPTITSAVVDPGATTYTPNSITISVGKHPVISTTPEDNGKL